MPVYPECVASRCYRESPCEYLNNQSNAARKITELLWREYDLHIVLYILGVLMRVAKWGNSLAVRLPDAVVKALKLKSGDEIEIVVSGAREFQVGRDKSRGRALARLRELKKPLPKGFRFDREEANAR